MDPSVDQMLTGFFVLWGMQLRGRRALRHLEAEQALRRCCEAHLEQYLTDAERFLVATERQLSPGDAAARLVEPDLLLAVLPHFVDEPAWFGADLEDRRVRLELVHRLLEFLVSYPPMRSHEGSGSTVPTRVALMRAQVDLGLRRERIRSTRRSDQIRDV